MTAQDMLSVISVVLLLIVVILMILQVRECPRWGEPIAWSIVALDGILFSISLTIERAAGTVVPATYNLWATSFKIHFLVTLIVIEGMRLWRQRVTRGQRGC